MTDNLRSRTELIEELVGLITGSLAWRSDHEIEGILEAMRVGETLAANGVRASNNSVVVCINSMAGKDAAVTALKELARRVDEEWEEFDGNTAIVVAQRSHVPPERLN